MSENSSIVQIAKLMNDPEGLDNEIKTAVAVLSGHFRKRFFEPVKEEIAAQKTKCIANPGNEVTLLQACRPFIKNQNLDRAIDIFNNIDVAKALAGNISSMSIDTSDNCIHPDGIYDVDKNCIVKSENKSENTKFPLIFVVIAILLLYEI